MPIEHHPLDQEFPEYVPLMRQLHTSDEEFRDMFEEYHILDTKIYNIDEDITPAADHYAEDDRHALAIARDVLAHLNRKKAPTVATQAPRSTRLGNAKD